MSKIETFSNSEFIVSFYDNYPIDPLDSNYNRSNRIHELLSKKSCLLIDSETILLENISNPLIKNLIKSSQTGGSEIIEIPDHFEAIRNDFSFIEKTINCSPIYMFSDRIPCNSEKYGIYIHGENTSLISFDEISHEVEPISVLENDKSNDLWSRVFKYKPPLNTIIICDNYILDNEKEFEKNIFTILRKLIPTKSNVDIHISIITKDDLINPKEKHKIIQNFISSINPKNKFGIYLTTLNKPHDRMIISNYFQLDSGHGFQLFNEKGNLKSNKTTKITVIPFLSTKTILAFTTELTKLAKHTKGCTVYGERSNRLLKYYSQ